MYAASRKFLLTGADGVVFVANSAADRWEDTLEKHERTERVPCGSRDRPQRPISRGVPVQQARPTRSDSHGGHGNER